MELRAQAIQKYYQPDSKREYKLHLSLLGGTFILKWNIMTTENKVSIHFQMMLKNHFSCYVVIKATYQSFHSNTALDSVPMPALWLMLSISKYTQFHFMITNFHYLIAVYSVSLDMLFEYWYRYLFTYEKEQERSFTDSTGLPLWNLSNNRKVSPWWKW